MRRSIVLIAGFFFSVGARAGWTGDPTQSLKKGAVVMGYQTDTRSVELTGGSPTKDFQSRGFVVEFRNALNPVVQLSFRALPFTGRMNLEDTSFNPHMAGAGVGLYLAPPEPLGPIHLGAAAVWDGAGGAQKRETSSKEYDRVFSSDTTLAAGASWYPVEWIGVYAGAAYDSFRMRFAVSSYAKTNWKENSPWGGYGGVTYSPNEAWFLSAEVRGGGERSLGAFLGYKY
jgi:hypothetical protein